MGCQLIAKPAETLGADVVTQELDRVGVRQVQLWVFVEARQPGPPVLVFKNAEQVGEVRDRGVRVILYRLPKMFGGIVSRAIEFDPFFDRIPVGEHPRWNGWSRAPAVQ